MISSLEVRGVRISTPYFLAPINTGFGVNGAPDERLVHFHKERSGRSIGVSYVGNVAIAESYKSNKSTLVFSDDLDAWAELAKAIQHAGSVAGVQLACKLSSSQPTTKWRNPDVESYVVRSRQELCEVTSTKVRTICNGFVAAAQRAARAGFQLVQIHAAHGYFLSQLLSPQLNCRKDIFGEEPTRAVTDIVSQIRQAAPALIVDVRISLRDYVECGAVEYPRRRQQIAAVVAAGADMVSLTDGHYEIDRFKIYPTKDDSHALHLPNASTFARCYPETLWNVAGNIYDLRSISPPKTPNLTYSIGRALIADPEYVEKVLEGRIAEVRHCVRSGHCHYYTRGRPHIECKVNSEL